MKIFVTGSAGFIAGYLIEDLLADGIQVVGIDNYSKYGPIERSYDQNPNYALVVGDAKNVSLMKELIADCDHLIAAAAMIGGISYFHEHAYDLLAENERILSSTFDAAIWAHKNRKLKKITVVSSSMVYESVSQFPLREGDERRNPPPISSYGWQKLSSEYFAYAAHEQFGLPYTIARPFNCVGLGEVAPHDVGSVKMATSHVVPDLIMKSLQGHSPLPILGSGHQIRHFTAGTDLAKGLRLCMEHPAALNQDFNLSTARSTEILELAKMIWHRIHPDLPFRYKELPPFKYDVQKRIPATDKAKTILGFEAHRNLESVLDEMIPWFKKHKMIANHESR